MKNKKTIIIIGCVAAGVVIAFLAARCYVGSKIKPGKFQAESVQATEPQGVGRAGVQTITESYEAVGTVRPRTESRIEAQVSAQIIDVKVNPGDKVVKGQLLVALDNRQFLSRLDQAKQGLQAAVAGEKQAGQAVIAAEAAFSQAESAFKRTQTYFASQAATSQDMEQAESAFLQAQAGLKRAKEGLKGAQAGIKQAGEVVKEAQIALDYTRVVAPQSGEVLKRLAEPGDLAVPGKPLLILQTAGALRLEAFVREGLIARVKTGTVLEVVIETLDTTMSATVDEIIPYADPQTRTFLVKASLPETPGLYPGMFGTLLIPVQERRVVVIPSRAIRRVGQLELVSVREDDIWKTRYIKTGRTFGEDVEVLSGLSGKETIGVEEPQ